MLPGIRSATAGPSAPLKYASAKITPSRQVRIVPHDNAISYNSHLERLGRIDAGENDADRCGLFGTCFWSGAVGAGASSLSGPAAGESGSGSGESSCNAGGACAAEISGVDLRAGVHHRAT